MIYTPPALQNGQSATVSATVSVAGSGSVAQTDPTPITIDAISAPLISGTVANEPVSGAVGSFIRPFATTTVTDTDFAYSAKDTATIKITDGGTLTDADGLLTGPGLSKTPGTAGTYTLSSPDYAYTISNELRNLVFTLATAQPRTIGFELDVTDPKTNLTTTDTTTSVGVIPPPAAPVIAGTLAGQTVAAGSAIKPLASVTISDGNAAPSDVAAISLLNSAGTASDANGTLSGPGLTETAPGKRYLHPRCRQSGHNHRRTRCADVHPGRTSQRADIGDDTVQAESRGCRADRHRHENHGDRKPAGATTSRQFSGQRSDNGRRLP